MCADASAARVAATRRTSPPTLATAHEVVDGSAVFSLRLWLRGGAAREAVPGLASLSGRLLAEGTSRRSWSDLAEFTEGHGIALAAVGGLESHGVAIDCLGDDWRLAIDLAAELVFDSQFQPDRLELQRQQTIAELRSLADQPDVRTSWTFLDQIYRPFALSRSLLGSAEAVAGIEASRCRSFHNEALARGGLLVTSGGASPEQVSSTLTELFGEHFELAGGDVASDLEPPTIDGADEAVREVELPDSQQLHVFAGHLTVPRVHADAAALEVLGVALGAGSGLNGRFPHRLREVEGLGYVAHAHAIAGAGRAPGRFVVYLGTTPDERQRATTAIREELDRLLQDGLTQQEFDDARNYLRGREALRRETAAQRADLRSEALYFGQPLHDLQWVDRRFAVLELSDVDEVARRWLDPERLRWTFGVPAGNGVSAAHEVSDAQVSAAQVSDAQVAD